MKSRFVISWKFLLVVVLLTGVVYGQSQPRIGIRGGIGTDINLGIAYGLGVIFSSI